MLLRLKVSGPGFKFAIDAQNQRDLESAQVLFDAAMERCEQRDVGVEPLADEVSKAWAWPSPIGEGDPPDWFGSLIKRHFKANGSVPPVVVIALWKCMPDLDLEALESMPFDVKGFVDEVLARADQMRQSTRARAREEVEPGDLP